MTSGRNADNGEGVEPYAWASEWQGHGGRAHALHHTEEDAIGNASWMNGRFFALYTRPLPDAGDRERVAELIRAEEEEIYWACERGNEYDALGLADAILATLTRKDGG